jgi:hypothetical protein
MYPTLTASGLALLGLCGGPAVPCTPTVVHAPYVVRWPGGSVTLNGPETIVRQHAMETIWRQHGPTHRSLNVVTGSGNGVGNTIVVDNGSGGGLTVVRNARNGIGNRLILDSDDWLLDLTPPRLDPPVVTPPAVAAASPTEPLRDPVYNGRATKFWTQKIWSDSYDCNLYWCPTHAKWFRYHREDDAYRPVPGNYDPAADGS